jgi:hypothetical protein
MCALLCTWSNSLAYTVVIIDDEHKDVVDTFSHTQVSLFDTIAIR